MNAIKKYGNFSSYQSIYDSTPSSSSANGQHVPGSESHRGDEPEDEGEKIKATFIVYEIFKTRRWPCVSSLRHHIKNKKTIMEQNKARRTTARTASSVGSYYP